MIKNLKVKHLIKKGLITDNFCYRKNFTMPIGRGFYSLQKCHNRIYFFAKLISFGLPIRIYMVNRETIIKDLEDDIRKSYPNVEFYPLTYVTENE